jgi:hypothetical protein
MKTPALTLVPATPGARGRLLTVPAVMELLPGKSRWWTTQKFCPERRLKIGRDCYWYELDAWEWIDAQRAPEARA